MQKNGNNIELDASRLYGYRILKGEERKAALTTLGAKVGDKTGRKGKMGAKVGGKVGGKVGTKHH